MDAEEFIKKLLTLAPKLKLPYQQHLEDNGKLLPHVFMGDVTRFIISEVESGVGSQDVNNLLNYFEDALATGDKDIENLISVSFVENLIGEEKTINFIKPQSGPRLKLLMESILK